MWVVFHSKLSWFVSAEVPERDALNMSFLDQEIVCGVLTVVPFNSRQLFPISAPAV